MAPQIPPPVVFTQDLAFDIEHFKANFFHVFPTDFGILISICNNLRQRVASLESVLQALLNQDQMNAMVQLAQHIQAAQVTASLQQQGDPNAR